MSADTDRDTDPGLRPVKPKTTPPAEAPASRKVQAFRWYSLAVVLLLAAAKYVELDADLVKLALQCLTGALISLFVSNAAGDHGATALGKVGEVVAGAMAGRRS